MSRTIDRAHYPFAHTILNKAHFRAKEESGDSMPRLTAELIADSPQFTNPVKDWELDLRGT